MNYEKDTPREMIVECTVGYQCWIHIQIDRHIDFHSKMNTGHMNWLLDIVRQSIHNLNYTGKCLFLNPNTD